jgi:hypothetical protein
MMVAVGNGKVNALGRVTVLFPYVVSVAPLTE